MCCCIWVYMCIYGYIWVYIPIYGNMDPARQPTHHLVVYAQPAVCFSSQKHAPGLLELVLWILTTVVDFSPLAKNQNMVLLLK